MCKSTLALICRGWTLGQWEARHGTTACPLSSSVFLLCEVLWHLPHKEGTTKFLRNALLPTTPLRMPAPPSVWPTSSRPAHAQDHGLRVQSQCYPNAPATHLVPWLSLPPAAPSDLFSHCFSPSIA
ncbi:unnamed protein product, partial [Discosporangium mesarthrocarpum]